MNKINFNKLYSHLGIILCAAAGAIIGFVLGNIFWAIPGLILGGFIGHFLEKRVAKA
jgi:uncharacterized membrane protein